MDDNREYCRRRAADEAAAADRATCPEAARAHRELAKRYSQMAGETERSLIRQSS